MLTPSKDDPNYKAEMKRRDAQPDTFGQEAEKPKSITDTRDFSTSGLVADRDAPTTTDAADGNDDAPADLDDPWQVYLDQSVAAITGQLADLDDEQLQTLKVAEVNSKNRVSLLDAINKEVNSRES